MKGLKSIKSYTLVVCAVLVGFHWNGAEVVLGTWLDIAFPEQANSAGPIDR